MKETYYGNYGDRIEKKVFKDGRVEYFAWAADETGATGKSVNSIKEGKKYIKDQHDFWDSQVLIEHEVIWKE